MRVEVEVRRRRDAVHPTYDCSTVAMPAAPPPPTTVTATRRITGANTSTRQQISTSPQLITEAYVDHKFVAPTRFFTAAPEHPKLGMWAQPSTLKYCHYAYQVDSDSNHLPRQANGPALARPILSFPSDDRIICSNTNDSKSRQVSSPGGRSKRHEEYASGRKDLATVRSGGATAAGPGRSICGTSRTRQQFEPARSRSPPRIRGSFLGRAESPPSSWSRGQKLHIVAAPRIDTPVSGRVSTCRKR